MSKRRLAVAVASALCCLVGNPSGFAQTTYEADFETTFPTFGYSYGYSGYGELDYSATDTSSQTTATYDVSTPPAAMGSFDTSQWMLPGYETYTYAGWGLGIGFYLPEGMRPTSGDLSQYTLQFDAKLTGYDENVAPNGLETSMQVILQGPGGSGQEYRIGVDGNNLGNFAAVPRLTSTPQTFTFPLSDLADVNDRGAAGNYWDFPTMFTDTSEFLLQLQPAGNAGEIGLDNDNVLMVDNVRIEGPFASAQVLLGDYDGNGVVEVNDYLTWRQEFGASGDGLLADGNANGTVDAADYTLWRDNYVAAGSSLAVAVPEPTGLACSGILLALMSLRRRRRS